MRDNVIQAAHRFALGKIVNADKTRVCLMCAKRQYVPDLGCLSCGYVKPRI